MLLMVTKTENGLYYFYYENGGDFVFSLNREVLLDIVGESALELLDNKLEREVQAKVRLELVV